MTKLIIGYILLYIFTYYINRFLIFKRFGKDTWGWVDVVFNLFSSLLLLPSSLFILICFALDKLFDNKTPPFWL